VKFFVSHGSTPLLDSDLEGLRIPTIQTQGELDAAEQRNIEGGKRWAKKSRLIRNSLLELRTLRSLHKRMFGEVWKWAGQNRISEANIGSAPELITEQTAETLLDAKAWIEHRTFGPEEICIRVHHRIVKIHPFRNGNGRVTREFAELLALQLKCKIPVWGGNGYQDESIRRADYLRSLKAADNNDLGQLIEFAYRD